MTTQQINSIKSSIADCDRYIAKEGARNPALRPVEVSRRLEWYISHRAKLTNMLNG